MYMRFMSGFTILTSLKHIHVDIGECLNDVLNM